MARMVRVRSVALLAANPISSTYLPHCSAVTTGSKYSRMKLKRADRSELTLSESLLYAKVLLAKMNSSMTVGPPSAISDKPGSNQACRMETSLPSVVLRPTRCQLHDWYWYNYPYSDCSFSSDPKINVAFRWVSSVQIKDLHI